MPNPADNDVSAIWVSQTPATPASTKPPRDFSTSVESFSFSIESTAPPANPKASARASYSFADVIERYRLETLLGKGGFGEVWKAFDVQTQRYVAIKGPRTDRRITPELAQLFLAEAEKVRQVAGLSVVPVLDVVQAPTQRDGQFLCFIVMQLMEGGSLAAKIRSGERPSPRQSVAWVITLADTLAKIHSQGYIHRDIKPDNILFDAAGRPYFSDFGLAASASEQLAEDPALRGTVAYMAPEQARGQRVDRQADIYSLGVVLYQLLALPFCEQPRLALPYLANSSEEYLEALSDPNQQVRTLPEGAPKQLAEIVERRCLTADKAQRFRSASDLSLALRQWLRSISWTRRGVLLAMGSVATSAAGYGTFRWLGAAGDDQPDPENSASASSSGSENVVHRAEEAIQLVNLLDRRPPIREDWSINAEMGELSIHTTERILIAFGKHVNEAIEFAISLRPSHWLGEVGVFFGHTTTPNGMYYQALKLVKKSDGRISLRCSGNIYSAHDPTGNHAASQVREWTVQQLQPDFNTLQITLAQGELAVISFNKLDLSTELVPRWKESVRGANARGSGDFGVFAYNSPGIFTNTVLNGRSTLIQQ